MKATLPPPSSASSSAPPPSYHETVSTPTQNRLPTNPPTYASSLRTTRISALVNDHIINHVCQSLMNAISSTTLILVPSDVWKLKNVDTSNSYVKRDPDFKFSGEQILGFPSSDNLTIERLTGPDHKLEFWRQASVIRELSLQIRRALEIEGYHVVDYVADRKVQVHPGNGVTSPSLELNPVEWKIVEQPPLADGEARTNTEVKEVTLRLENEMGLYETRSGMAIVVKTDIGGVRGEVDY